MTSKEDSNKKSDSNEALGIGESKEFQYDGGKEENVEHSLKSGSTNEKRDEDNLRDEKIEFMNETCVRCGGTPCY